jgi:hypothetical protein
MALPVPAVVMRKGLHPRLGTVGKQRLYFDSGPYLMAETLDHMMSAPRRRRRLILGINPPSQQPRH